MKPEIGNPEIHVDQEMVCQAFREAGAVVGDTVLFHGSLSSMGTVVPGPVAVFDGILDATGPGGTVAMPTLWYNGKEGRRDPADFDPLHSSAYNGALAEGIRVDARSIRSNHFSHAVSAIGRRAIELTASHGATGLAPTPWCERAFADDSPWHRLYLWNALHAFIGVDMTVCTMKHYVESHLVMRLLSLLPPDAREAKRSELSQNRTQRFWPFFPSGEMELRLIDLGLERQTRLGSATLRVIRTRPLVETLAQLVWDEPERWLNDDFLKWRADILKRKVNTGTDYTQQPIRGGSQK